MPLRKNLTPQSGKGIDRICKEYVVQYLDPLHVAGFHAEYDKVLLFQRLGRHEPEETCFCKVFGVDAAQPASDVAVWTVGEDLFWKAEYDKVLLFQRLGLYGHLLSFFSHGIETFALGKECIFR